MHTGVLKFWQIERGYGFILRDDGQDDAFVHWTALADGRESISQDQRVSFDMGEDKKTGRPCAVNVTVLK
jgi:CspA family cold shock protein